MQEVARAALLLHVKDEDMYGQQDDLSALLIRPLLRNAESEYAFMMYDKQCRIQLHHVKLRLIT